METVIFQSCSYFQSPSYSQNRKLNYLEALYCAAVAAAAVVAAVVVAAAVAAAAAVVVVMVL